MKLYRKLWLAIVRSKTNLFAAALAGLSALQLAIPTFAETLTPTEFAGLGVAVAAGIAFFRSITKEPIKDKVER